MTQDRLAERRFVEAPGIAVAPWREVRSVAEARAAADALGLPLRLKLPIGGYDGRGQLRIADAGRARRRLGAPRPAARRRRCSPSASSTSQTELSVVVARATRRRGRDLPDRPEPRTTPGSSSSRWRRRRSPPDVADCAAAIGATLAAAMDLCGTLTVELFLLRRRVAGRQRARAARPQLGPLDDRGRRDLAVRAAHPGDLRARARLDGRAWPRPRWSTSSGSGPRRPARLLGVAEALADPAVHLHLYDKREVFERRKMGHLTALGADVDDGARHGARARWRAWPGRTRRRRRTTDDRGEPPGRPSSASSAAAAPTSRSSRRRSRSSTSSACRRSSRSCRRTERPIGCSATPRRPPAAGIRVIVAGAGGAAHLPGMLAAKTALPVIGVPIPTEHLGGLDSLLSIVQMPRGVPVATVAIGNATNAGLLAAAILALSDPALAERLAAWRARQTQAVLDDPSNVGRT